MAGQTRTNRTSATHLNQKDGTHLKNNYDSFTVGVAIFLIFSFGVLITIGSYQWVVTKLHSYFKISYAGFAWLIISVFIFSELWAVFVQIPEIHGYGEAVGQFGDCIIKGFGFALIIAMLMHMTLYLCSPTSGWYKTILAKGLYCVSGLARNTIDDRLRILDEVIEERGATAADFDRRGTLYLEAGRIKAAQEEGYEYVLPKISMAECFENAVINFSDAINRNDDDPKYYCHRGDAYYESIPAQFESAKDDYEKAIGMDGDSEEYHFGAAKAYYQIGDEDNNGAYKKALEYISTAIRLHREKNGFEEAENTESDDEKSDKRADEPLQDEQLAEYYYYEGLIHKIYDKSTQSDVASSMEFAVRYHKANVTYLSELGRAYYGIGSDEMLKKADKVFDKAIERNKEESKYYEEAINIAWKAYTLEAIGDDRMEEALGLYIESAGLRPDYPFVYRQMANIYLSRDDKENIYSTYNNAIRNCTENAEFYYGCGEVHYASMNDIGEDRTACCKHTITDMEKAIERNYASIKDCYWYIASSYYCMESYQKAYDNYQIAIQNGYDKAAVKEYMDYCLQFIGN